MLRNSGLALAIFSLLCSCFRLLLHVFWCGQSIAVRRNRLLVSLLVHPDLVRSECNSHKVCYIYLFICFPETPDSDVFRYFGIM